jgi:hypothetical protein
LARFLSCMGTQLLEVDHVTGCRPSSIAILVQSHSRYYTTCIRESFVENLTHLDPSFLGHALFLAVRKHLETHFLIRPSARPLPGFPFLDENFVRPLFIHSRPSASIDQSGLWSVPQITNMRSWNRSCGSALSVESSNVRLQYLWNQSFHFVSPTQPNPLLPASVRKKDARISCPRYMISQIFLFPLISHHSLIPLLHSLITFPRWRMYGSKWQTSGRMKEIYIRTEVFSCSSIINLLHPKGKLFQDACSYHSSRTRSSFSCSYQLESLFSRCLLS